MMNTQQLPEGFTKNGRDGNVFDALPMADEQVQIAELAKVAKVAEVAELNLGPEIQAAGGTLPYMLDIKRILAENGMDIQWMIEFSGEPTINAPSYESELESEHSMSMGG